MILIKNGLVILDAYDTPRVRNIVIDRSRILEITSHVPEESGAFREVIDASDQIIIPGIINGHTHSYANLVRASEENLPLETMMFHIMAQGVCQSAEDIYYNALLGAVEMLKNGITSCFDQLAQPVEGLDAAMTAYDRIGMRATVAPMISDQRYYDTLPLSTRLIPERMQSPPAATAESLLAVSTDFLKKWHGKRGRLGVAFGPSGPQRCSDELLKACMNAAEEYDTVFHTHTLETRTQKHTAHYLYGKDMVRHLDEIGCLNERTSMAHGVWLTREEAELVRDRGGMIVHCPASNYFLGSGVAPLNMYRELGVTVGLGTDGSNCSGNQNMLETMKLAAIMHKVSEPDPARWIDARETLKMATLHNARITRQEHRIGSIAAGKEADLVILDPSKSSSLQPLQHCVRQIVYAETGSAVDTVLVGGQTVVKNGKCVLVDEHEVYAEANRRARRLETSLRDREGEIQGQVSFLESVLPK